jgi:Zn-dependent M28 family amino/carboxypeptidase
MNSRKISNPMRLDREPPVFRRRRVRRTRPALRTCQALLFCSLLVSLPACRPASAPLPPPSGTAAAIASAKSLSAALSSVSGDRALANATGFADLGPKLPGTPGSAAAADWLLARFAEAGAAAVPAPFTDDTPAGPAAFRNVVATIPPAPGSVPPGKSPSLLLVAAHYDTKSGIPGFVGANDSASGVAVLLELARAWTAEPLPGTEIRLACLDGEECAVRYGPRDGLHGSRRWAADLEASGDLPRVRAFLLLDMVGDADLTLTLPRNCTPSLLTLAFEAARAEGIRNRVSLSPGPVLDDHVPFFERGVPALDLIDFQYGSAPGLNDYWHTPADTPDKLSGESLAFAARLVLRIAAALPCHP